MKLNAQSEGNPNGIPGSSRTPSERSDAGTSIVQEVFGFVKRNLSGAQRRKSAASGERGAGKGAAALVPASAHRNPERVSAPRCLGQAFLAVKPAEILPAIRDLNERLTTAFDCLLANNGGAQGFVKFSVRVERQYPDRH